MLVWGNTPQNGQLDYSILVWGNTPQNGQLDYSMLVWGNTPQNGQLDYSMLVWGNTPQNGQLDYSMLVWANTPYNGQLDYSVLARGDLTTRHRQSQSLTKSELTDRLKPTKTHGTLSLVHDFHLHGLATVRHHTDSTLTTRRPFCRLQKAN